MVTFNRRAPASGASVVPASVRACAARARASFPSGCVALTASNSAPASPKPSRGKIGEARVVAPRHADPPRARN